MKVKFISRVYVYALKNSLFFLKQGRYRNKAVFF